MQKNVTGQKCIVYAYDSTTNTPKTGDATNITAYVSKDFGAVTVLGDTSATEMDATNAKGYYLFDLTQAETNGDALLFTAKSSSLNVVVLGTPDYIQTIPAAFVVAGGAAGGVFIAGTNVATTINGTAASGATPAVAALTLTGGAASTSSGGVSSPAIKVTGGAGAASTNGAASGITSTGGGTNTVGANADGLQLIASSGGGRGLLISSSSGGNAVTISSSGNGVSISAGGGGTGLNIIGGQNAVNFTAGTGGLGLNITGGNGSGAGTPGAGISITGGAGGGTTAAGDGIIVTGGNASGTNAAGAGINITGGAASTGAGGIAGSAIKAIGGAGAASTNGAAIGATITGGGTNTVTSTADGLKLTGTSNGSGLNCILAGTGGAITASTIVGTLSTLTTYTGNTPQTGDSFARIGLAGVGLTNLGDTRIANLDATISSRMAIYTQPTGFLAATFPTSVASTTNITAASGVALTSGYDFAKGTVAMTESYAAVTAAMTPVQALYQIVQQAGEASISGTTETVKKRNQSTTAKTFTINDATNPTAITETT